MDLQYREWDGMTVDEIEIPDAWQQLPVESFLGTILIVGATDTGKSTLARCVINRLETNGRTVAHLDGDPGQGELGPPATMTLRRPDGETVRWFVGATSPRGHMLPVVTGARRLVDAASGTNTVVYDTTGLVEPSPGGLYLKLSLLDLLRPNVVLALRSDDELESLLEPLRGRSGIDLRELPVPGDVETRDQEARSECRRRQFRDYFSDVGTLSIRWPDYSVRPDLDFTSDRLIGLCDGDGFLLKLGLVKTVDRGDRTVTILTPPDSTDDLVELRPGDLRVDPDTGEHERR